MLTDIPEDPKRAKLLALTQLQYLLEDDVLFYVVKDGSLRVIPQKSQERSYSTRPMVVVLEDILEMPRCLVSCRSITGGQGCAKTLAVGAVDVSYVPPTALEGLFVPPLPRYQCLGHSRGLVWTWFNFHDLMMETGMQWSSWTI